MAKIKSLQNNILFDGTIPIGIYSVNGILKIVELFWRTDTNRPCIGTKLLPTYNKGNTINLKKSKRTIDFQIVFYEKLSVEQNILFLNNYLRHYSEVNRCKFLSLHAQPLSIVLGNKFEEFYLQAIFEMDSIPDQFEIWHNGKRIASTHNLHKDYESNPKEFSLVSYQKLD